MCIRIYILNFKKQQTNKRKQESKKQKKLKKKREFLRKIDKKKKKKCSRPVEDFSRHPHFRKEEYFFWPYYIAMKLIWR